MGDEISYDDINSQYNEIENLEAYIKTLNNCHEIDQFTINSLKDECNEKEEIIHSLQTNLESMSFMIEKFQNQREGKMKNEIDKIEFLKQLSESQIEVSNLRSTHEEDIRNNEAKINELKELHKDELKAINDKLISQEIEFQKSFEDLKNQTIKEKDEMTKNILSLKEEFLNKENEYLSKIHNLEEELREKSEKKNTFTNSITAEIFRKKYENLQEVSNRKIAELTNKINMTPKNFNQKLVPQNHPPFVTAAHLLNPLEEPITSMNNTPHLITNLSDFQNMIYQIKPENESTNSILSVNTEHIAKNSSNTTKNNDGKVGQKRKLFSVNSINCLNKF